MLSVCSSCSLSLFSGYQRYQDTNPPAPVSWFSRDTSHFLFNTKIDIYKNHFSGLMVIKQATGGNYRVVFITEVGLKIFDMEFLSDGKVKIHYIMDAMNKKALISTLSNDISLILMNRISDEAPVKMHKKGSPDSIFRYTGRGKKNYYHLAGTAVHPHLIKQTSGITNKVRADLYGTGETGIDSIKIDHYNIRLSIYLFRINE